MGVHLDEPTTPVSNRWSGQMTMKTSPIQKQWTEEDLDAFVRQLSNPQHHVTKIPPLDRSVSTVTPPSSSTSPRKSSLDLSDNQKVNRRARRAPLSRSETDSTVQFGDHREVTAGPAEKPESSRSSGFMSTLSGLRLIKNKKLTRSSHATAKKCQAQKSKEDTSSCGSPGLLASHLSAAVDEDPNGDVFKETPVFTGGASSPENSDGEQKAAAAAAAAAAAVAKDASNGSTVKEGGKKRRFRKMLSRPLKRSQSAGCAKDVPVHSLFLDEQRRKSKDAETSSIRKERASEGDIHHPPTSDEESTCPATSPVDEDYERKHGAYSLGAGIHKTKSADAAMLAGEDFPSIAPQSKSKSRNIAKKISRHMQFLRRRHTDSTLGTMDKEETKRLADLDPSQVQHWSRSFESLLSDKNGLELFRGFLVSEHSDENIEFWIACQNYKTVKSHKQLAPLAQKIFYDYVAVQARREINLDSKTRSMTQESVASNPNRQTFDEAQRRVQALMEKDSYRRFLESELYQDLASGSVQHHK